MELLGGRVVKGDPSINERRTGVKRVEVTVRGTALKV